MRRHRSLVLVPAMILSAACTRRDDAKTENPLDRDLTLSAQLQKGQADSSALTDLASGGACTKEPTPATPTASQRTQAVALEQRAAEAEFVGNIQAARELHRRAARLDGTSEEIAYRLARADEAVGAKGEAIRGYCRYLTLAPSAANAKEVRTRLMALASATPAQAQPQQQVATQSQSQRSTASTSSTAQRSNNATRRVTYVPTTGRAAGSRVATAAPARTTAPAANNQAAATQEGVGPSNSGNATPVEPQTVYGTSAGEVVTQQSQEPQDVQQPMPTTTTTKPSARRSTDHTLRNAAIGAAAGAAVGGMASRSAKGAVVGGIAGGILGAVIGRANHGPTTTFRTPGWAH